MEISAPLAKSIDIISFQTVKTLLGIDPMDLSAPSMEEHGDSQK